MINIECSDMTTQQAMRLATALQLLGFNIIACRVLYRSVETYRTTDPQTMIDAGGLGYGEVWWIECDNQYYTEAFIKEVTHLVRSS